MTAANRYTTTEFLASVRRKGHIPSSQTTFQDADLLAIANDEMSSEILSQIVSTREGFYKTYSDLTTNSSNVYDIPTRAIGGALTDVQIVNGTDIFQIRRCEESEQFSTVTSPSGFWSFKIQGNQFTILPTITTGSVRAWHLRRPNAFVVTTAAAQITAINQGSGVLTFASLPSTFSASTPFDCIADQPHFNWRFVDYTPTGITSTTITFSSLPTDQYGNALIQVGDWVALAGQSPVPQLPVEFSPLLVQRTVVKYYEAQNYKDKAALAEKKLQDMEKALFELINPRVASSPKMIIPNSNIIGGYNRARSWRAT